MERRFYTDESFEQFLKDTTDNFRMYPQRKVWYSIYNNLHPSRKWPSLSVLLLLIASVMFIGVSNKKDITQPFELSLFDYNVDENPFDQTSVTVQDNFTEQNNLNNITNSTNVASTQTSIPALQTALVETTALHFHSKNRLNVTVSKPSFNYFTQNLQPELIAANNSVEEEELIESIEEQKEKIKNIDISEEEAPIANIPKPKKGKGLIATHFYVTPSFGYRNMKSNANFSTPTSMQMALISLPDQPQTEVSHNAAINVELGGGIYYSLNKSVRLKTGLQLNYTNYKINAHALTHAAMATVLLNGPVPNSPTVISTPTQTSNVGFNNNIQLNSSTVQVSIPIGVDYLLAQNEHVKWYVGATVQPTYIAGGNAFMLSSDKNYYIADASIIRDFNLNGAFETFFSYQPISGVTLNVGPQIRYQFFSTYRKVYPISENLYNIGIKLGITTRF